MTPAIVEDPALVHAAAGASTGAVHTDAALRLRLESTLLRDERLLKTYHQPRAVLEQMKECGIRTMPPGGAGSSGGAGDQSNSDTDFFDSVD